MEVGQFGMVKFFSIFGTVTLVCPTRVRKHFRPSRLSIASTAAPSAAIKLNFGAKQAAVLAFKPTEFQIFPMYGGCATDFWSWEIVNPSRILGTLKFVKDWFGRPGSQPPDNIQKNGLHGWKENRSGFLKIRVTSSYDSYNSHKSVVKVANSWRIREGLKKKISPSPL